MKVELDTLKKNNQQLIDLLTANGIEIPKNLRPASTKKKPSKRSLNNTAAVQTQAAASPAKNPNAANWRKSVVPSVLMNQANSGQ